MQPCRLQGLHCKLPLSPTQGKACKVWGVQMTPFNMCLQSRGHTENKQVVL